VFLKVLLENRVDTSLPKGRPLPVGEVPGGVAGK